MRECFSSGPSSNRIREKFTKSATDSHYKRRESVRPILPGRSNQATRVMALVVVRDYPFTHFDCQRQRLLWHDKTAFVAIPRTGLLMNIVNRTCEKRCWTKPSQILFPLAILRLLYPI